MLHWKITKGDQQMTVSFCVIAYNEEKNMESLFSDIRKQDYPHDKMEIIFVNAMSTDKTKYLMEQFAKEENGFIRVRVIDNPKKIQAAGWNVAIKAASEDIILRVDAHTMIPKDFVSNSVKSIESGEYVTGGPRPNIVDESTPWKHTLLLAETSLFGSSIAPYRKSNHKTYVKSVFHGAYRREVFEKAGLFDESLGRTEDNELHYRIRKAGYKICYDPRIVSYQHSRGTWREMIRQKYGNGFWIGLTLGVCPKCFSVFHFVPLFFVLSILASIIFALLGLLYPFKVLLIIYILINLMMSVLAIRGQKFYLQYLMLPFIFLSLHLSYGIGTLVGLIKMPIWKKKRKKRNLEQ